jgi:hypothetical protein
MTLLFQWSERHTIECKRVSCSCVARQTKPVQELSEPAAVIEAISTVEVHVSGLFSVRLTAEWQARPTFEAQAIEIEEAIRACSDLTHEKAGVAITTNSSGCNV